MKRKFTMQKGELCAVLINLIVAKMLFNYPRYLIQRCGNNAWMAVLIYGAAGVLIYYLTQLIYARSGKMSVLSHAEAIGGRWLKIATGHVLSFFILINCAPVIRACPEAVKTALLQNTKMVIIVFVLSVGVVIGTYNGIEALGRATAFFVPCAGIILIGFLLMLIPHCNINNLFPISPKEALTGGSAALSIFSDIIVINLLLPYCKDMKTFKKGGMYGVIIAYAASFAITFMYCLVYPYPASERFIVPMYQLARLVSIGTYFQRLEAIFEFVWTLSNLFYTAVYLFVLCDIFRQSYDLAEFKPLIVPMMLIVLRVAFRNETYSEALRENFSKIMYVYPGLYLIAPAMALVYIIKEERRKKSEKSG